MHDLRDKLVDLALTWERTFGNAPHITAALSELDAARLVGCSIDEYAECMHGVTAVRRGHDFEFKGQRYQVKANRPSGKPGSVVTLVPKAKNFDWDLFIRILYDKDYKIQEAWLWEWLPIGKHLLRTTFQASRGRRTSRIPSFSAFYPHLRTQNSRGLTIHLCGERDFKDAQAAGGRRCTQRGRGSIWRSRPRRLNA